MGDDDIYAALVSGAPTDQQRQMALANALRQQAMKGQIYSLSGDRVIAPMGQHMLASAQTEAEQVSQEREKQQQLDTMQQYRQAEAQRFQQDLAERAREANMSDARARDLANLMSETKLDVAGMKGPAGGAKKLSASERENLEKMRDVVNGFDQTANAFDDKYSGVGVPGGRHIRNVIAQNMPGLSSDDDKAAQNWWQNYLRQFKMEEMNRLFKSRLTGNEIGIFDQAHVSENMDPNQLRGNMTQISNGLHRALESRLKEYQAGGYDTDFLQSIASDVGPRYGIDPQAAAAARANPAGVRQQMAFPGAQPGVSGVPQAQNGQSPSTAMRYLMMMRGPQSMLPNALNPQPTTQMPPPQGNLLTGMQ